ncbi:hypothetical protein QAD02_015762 [Eretmocerus hayati]|uniref:Uncharacterized protein n=1 Tax=Eretmocerus hayati TaxID=131215 RepID=A0ACC2P8Q5_9HYME|nr:hypothetical protein QAD02_015762 [Eretmocerus hayati]
MARPKKKGAPKKKVVQDKDGQGEENNSFQNRRSSLRVNLSYTSNLSDSGNGSLKRTRHECDESASVKSSTRKNITVQATKKRKTRKDDVDQSLQTPSSATNVTVIEAPPVSTVIRNTVNTEDNPITIMKEKEQELNRSCRQLRNAIMSKTQALFDKENELAIKTSEVLATAHGSHSKATTEDDGSKTPTVRVDMGKNDQIVMSGDGKKKNPVQVNSMLRRTSPDKDPHVSSDINEENEDCNNSIVSTPKKPRLEASIRKSCHTTPRPDINIPVARLFTDDPNNSMSGVNAPPTLASQKIFATHHPVNNISGANEVSTNFNCSTSPILSQGARRSRFLRLSLKKKLTQPVDNIALRLSSSVANESFLKQFPLTCSSFKEKQVEKNDTGNTKVPTQNSNHPDNECRTICLEDDVNISKTIVISGDDEKTVEINSSNSKTVELQNSAAGSKMEMTGISSALPIISRSFQHVIRRSLNLDQIIPEKLSQSLSNTIQKQLSSNQNEDDLRDKVAGKHQREKRQSVSPKNVSRESRVDPLPTSLSVNTSLSQVKSQEQLGINRDSLDKSHPVVDDDDIDQVLERADTELIHPQDCDDIQHTTEESESLLTTKSRRSKTSSSNRKKSCTKVVSGPRESTSQTEKENSDDVISGPSTCSIRSSLKVNTSLDSVKKSSLTNRAMNLDRILTMVQESVSQDSLGNENRNSNSSTDQSSEDELENLSLSKRIKNLSAKKKEVMKKSLSRVSVNVVRLAENEIPGSTNMVKKALANDIDILANKKILQSKNDKSELDHTNKRKKSTSGSATKKSIRCENVSSTTESSVVENTPYPTSRSVLMKTMIKNSIAMNTLNPRNLVDFSDSDDSENQSQTNDSIHPALKMHRKGHSERGSPGQLLDTVLLGSSDESQPEPNQRVGCIIDETMDKSREGDLSNDNGITNKKGNGEKKSKNATVKRKLFPLRENSGLVSFSAEDIDEPQRILEVTEKVRPRKKRKITQQKTQKKKETTLNSPELVNDIEPNEDESQPKATAKPKKPRKIVRKKIVVKKVHNMTLLNDIMADGEPSRLSAGTSSAEFDLSKNRRKKKKKVPKKNNKIVIVITGLPKQDKDLVKSVIKALGSATLEFSVTPRTTHVVSSGIRTINLLKAIIRGCWLLSMEWVLRSLEENKWLDPNPYEMIHFSKAVQENRRDRQLFGKAYVPELFVTCGLIYVENGTTPPPPVLKDLIKIAGGRITEDFDLAQVVIGSEGLKENWVLDCITTGEMQSFDLYKQG